MAVVIVMLPGCASTSPRCDATSSLYDALLNSRIAEAKSLIKKGANVNCVGDADAGFTPLIVAAINGHTEIARLLVAKGANVKSEDVAGGTPLSHAAAFGRTGVARLLVDNGANVNSADITDSTPLMNAAKNGHTETAMLLIAKGADLFQRDSENYTALELAKAHKHTKTYNAIFASYSEEQKAAYNQDQKRNRIAVQQQAKKQSEQPQQVAEANTPADCLKLAAAIKACDQTGGFLAMGCKAAARSQYNCPIPVE